MDLLFCHLSILDAEHTDPASKFARITAAQLDKLLTGLAAIQEEIAPISPGIFAALIK